MAKIGLKEFLVTPWKNANLGKRVPIKQLNQEQATLLLVEFKKLYDKPVEEVSEDGETW